jgi:hypothetical protein
VTGTACCHAAPEMNVVHLTFVTSGRTAAVLTTHHIHAVCRDTQGMLALAPEHNQRNTTSADYAEIIHRVSRLCSCARCKGSSPYHCVTQYPYLLHTALCLVQTPVLVVDGGAELKCRIEVCVNEFLTKVQLKLPLRLAAALLIACAMFV